MSGVAMQRSKLIVPFDTCSTRSSAPTTIGAGGLGLLGLGAAREHGDARRAARAVRQIAHAAHHLVGVLGIDAEVHRDLDRLVELRLGALLDELHRLLDRVGLVAVDALGGRRHALAAGNDASP